MKRVWTVREYKKGDENGILELMKAVYPDKKILKESWMKWWKWMFTKSPAGAARIWLADHNGKIAGQYPLIISDMKVGKEIAKVSQNIELMTHPDYRKQGMFITLEKKALEKTAKEGINITIGFPNAAAYPGHIKTGWFDIGSLQIGVKPIHLKKIVETGIKNNFLKPFYVFFGKLIIYLIYREKKTIVSDSLKISKVNSFDNRINDFWEKNSKDYEITTVRKKEYLNWRYVDIPDIDYTIYIAEEKGEIRGYIVLRCVDEDNIKSGSIFDIFTPLERPDVTARLISKAIEFFKSQNVDLIFCLMVADKKIQKVIRKKGFIFSKFLQSGFSEGGQFIVYTSHPNISKPFLMNKENWYIQLGDSDSL